jgi:tetratricopeptide (TPR) repeat protein
LTLKKSDKAKVNEKLIQARLECKWSQADVAGKIGTTSVSVSRWERGITFPSPYFKEKLCQLYGKAERELGLAKENTANRKEQSYNEVLHEQVQLPRHLWSVPYNRSPFFTGRENILQDIHDKFSTNKAKLLTAAISGLGGIGKTLIAIEYAYQHRRDYDAVLWANAEDYRTLASDFLQIAGKDLLNLPERVEQNQELIITAVKRWLCTHYNWLLILDNVNDLEEVETFIPRAEHGRVLLTTRDQTLGDTVDYQLHIDKMKPEEAATFLLRRVRILPEEASLDITSISDQENANAIAEGLDYLPLALDQAGAYIDETKCGLPEYLNLYEKQHEVLLKRRSRLAIRYRETVTTTWSISFQKVERANPISADLLRFFAFLHADAIPEEIITASSQDLGPLIQQIDSALALNEAIEELIKYSFIKRNTDNRAVSIHRLVQTVLKDEMDKDERRLWAERTVHAVARIFPYADYTSLQSCERYFLHAQVCHHLIEKENFISIDASRLLREAGTYLQERGQYFQAESFLQASLNICEQLTAAQYPELLNSLGSLAILEEKLGKYTEAEHLYQKTLSIGEEVLGPEHPNLISNLNNLATLYISQGRIVDAEPLVAQVLHILEKGIDVGHNDVAHALHTAADLYLTKGDFTSAEPLYQQALAIREENLGAEHPEVANTLNDLAILYMHRGKLSEAERLYRRALTISEKALGPEHHFTAFKINNLAYIYMEQERFTEAEQMFRRALTIREQALGPEHSEVANSLNNLAALYNKQGKLAEAASYFERALVISEKAKGPDHPEVALCLTNLAEIYMKQNRYEAIEQLCQRALEITEKVYGADHPDAIYGLTILARLYSSQGKIADAEMLYTQALTIAKKWLGLEHPHTVVVSQYYADFLRKVGREVDALKLLEHVNLIDQKSPD